MRRRLAILTALCGLVGPLGAEAADEAGAFDYWVLSLSWSPTWCALEGDARGAAQCDRALGWSLHGLWPQYESGYPEYCATAARDPSRSETAAMADIMGSGGLAWHEWKKHGRCSGLAAEDYFALSRRAYGEVARPEALRRREEPVRLPARLVEEAFLAENAALFADALTVTCEAGRIDEVRICLSREELTPRRCGADVVRDCAIGDALLDPVR